MGTNYGNSDGTVSERLKNYLAARARGGFGLIITEIVAIDPLGRGLPNQLGIWDDSFIPGMEALAGAIHAEGAKLVVQLHHAGRQTHQWIIGQQPVAPSPLSCPVCREMPRQLSIKEIEELAEEFAEGAKKAREAGVDAVEIHGAHGYLIAQFLSSYANRRTDEYGGDLEGRLRFPNLVLSKIRQKVGNDYPIIFRISAEEKVPGGRGLEETLTICKQLKGVDAYHISIGTYGAFGWTTAPMAIPPGFNLYASEAVKKATNLPVIAVGRLGDPYIAELAIEQSKADLIALGRSSIADPEIPKKLSEGNYQEINWCISCNQGCIDRILRRKNYEMSCVVNPAVGREDEFRIAPVTAKRKVLVIGGGPAGMEAAWVAAARGHEVKLYEARDRLGGSLYLASLPPCKQDIAKAIKALSRRVAKTGVEVTYGVEVTARTIEELQPDVVVLATGAEPIIPSWVETTNNNVVTAAAVLAGEANVGKQAAILGGGMVGCETADYLAERGRRVTIFEQLPDVARDVGPDTRHFLLQRLRDRAVNIITSAKIEFVAEGCIRYVCNNEVKEAGGFDTIVVALGSTPKQDLRQVLESKGIEHFVIGDAVEARTALEAMAEGWQIGCSI